MRIPVLLVAACCALALLRARSAGAADDLLERYSATDRFRSGTPRAFVITPDHREVLFLRSGARDRVNALWSLDLASGAERKLLTASELLAGGEEKISPEERARRQRLRLSALGIASFELSRDGRLLLVPLSGRLFLVTRAGGAVRELAPGSAPAPAQDAHFSPDGASVACVRGGDLCVTDLASGATRTVIAHESPTINWGSPEFVAQEELDRFAGWWWSPDSKWLLAQRTDETNVERLRISDPFRPASSPQEWAYPRPGHENADVRLALLPAEGGAPRFVEWDRARWPYLCSVHWPERGGPVIEVMSRQQREAAALAVDAATGATRVLLTERDPDWLNFHHGAPHPLERGGLLWIAERDDSGPWLERRGAGNAAPVRLTPPGLRVIELLAVDEAAGAAWVVASDDPCESHVWRVALAGRPHVQRLGTDAGEETAVFARTGGLHVRTVKAAQGPPRWVVEDGTGRVRGAVRSVGEAPPQPNVEFTTVGADSLRVSIVRPREFQRSLRYPVIEFAYGGPHVNQVTRPAAGFIRTQWLADQGFIVVSIDGHGTPRRGRSWERAIRGDLIGPALADHVKALHALCARYPEMDGERIGVTGWSFGGYYSVLAVERAPETYKAAVAGAPVVDWRDYDTAYTERYLGLPQKDSLGYERSSALTDAARLSRPLLLIHGTADDNVYFFNSLKLADALNRAGRSWQMLPFPGEAHGFLDVQQVKQENARTAEFFREALGVPGDAAPPRP